MVMATCPHCGCQFALPKKNWLRSSLNCGECGGFVYGNPGDYREGRDGGQRSSQNAFPERNS